AAACKKAVEAGASVLSAPITKPWGQTVAYVRCPDGTLVELCTELKG
ncbi:MAG: VOC family protein, partial [Cytophagales bacterium]|nr:VOC family protein [Rhizobacter sp.]